MPLSEKTVKEYEKYKSRDYNYKRSYKISLDMYRDRLIDQDFKCAICKLRQVYCGNLQVDHCHKTNKIRSLLCRRCNMELARFEKHGSVNSCSSHLIDPNKEYTKYLNIHHREWNHANRSRIGRRIRAGIIKTVRS